MGATFELEVSKGRVIVLKELGAEEFGQVVDQAGGVNPSTEWKLVNFGLMRSIVKDRNEELSYQTLMGPQLERRFTTKEILLLRAAWQQIHLPSEEDGTRVREMRVVAQ